MISYYLGSIRLCKTLSYRVSELYIVCSMYVAVGLRSLKIESWVLSYHITRSDHIKSRVFKVHIHHCKINQFNLIGYYMRLVVWLTYVFYIWLYVCQFWIEIQFRYRNRNSGNIFLHWINKTSTVANTDKTQNALENINQFKKQ